MHLQQQIQRLPYFRPRVSNPNDIRDSNPHLLEERITPLQLEHMFLLRWIVLDSSE